MEVRVNTDRDIEGQEALSLHVRGIVENSLHDLSDRITRVQLARWPTRSRRAFRLSRTPARDVLTSKRPVQLEWLGLNGASRIYPGSGLA